MFHHFVLNTPVLTIVLVFLKEIYSWNEQMGLEKIRFLINRQIPVVVPGYTRVSISAYFQTEHKEIHFKCYFVHLLSCGLSKVNK